MDEGKSGEDRKCDAPEYGDSAAEGFGVGVDFSAAGFIDKADLEGEGSDEQRENEGEREAQWTKAEYEV